LKQEAVQVFRRSNRSIGLEYREVRGSGFLIEAEFEAEKKRRCGSLSSSCEGEQSMTTLTPSVSNTPGQDPTWHTLGVEDALRKQGVDAATGLSQAEAESRMKKYGANAFTEE